MEWQRVVKPGGHLVVVLPHYARTFDHRRTPTKVSHMLEDYERHTGEDDLTHVDEVFEAHRLNRQSGSQAVRQSGSQAVRQSESDEDLHALLINNFSHRMMHHHVFDEYNSKELLEAAGLKVLTVETQLPFHILLVAQNA